LSTTSLVLNVDEELPEDALPESGETYLECHIDRFNRAIVPMALVQEVIIVRAKNIVPVPNMPSYMLGLVSSHSRIYWTVDLAQMLGLQPIQVNTHACSVAILRIEPMYLAIAATEIKGVIKLASESIESQLEPINSDSMPYLKGFMLNAETKLHLLDVEALLKFAR